jgi:hypothetical protein
LSGIYLLYSKVREAFISHDSLGEAMVAILSLVNGNSGNFLNLKLRATSDRDGIFKFRIYDENTIPVTRSTFPEIYTFFTNNTSEFISAKVDFSLPSQVASSVIARQYSNFADSSTGDNVIHDEFINAGFQLDGTGTPAVRSLITEPVRTTDGTTAPNPPTVERAAEQLDNAERDLKIDGTLGYRELLPSQVLADNINARRLLTTIPSSAKINLKLLGLDGFDFGDMFAVSNILPNPYDENNVFMLTGYKHRITTDQWTTEIEGMLIATNEYRDSVPRPLQSPPSTRTVREPPIVVNDLPINNVVRVNEVLVGLTQGVQEIMNQKYSSQYQIVIDSGFRTPERNEGVDGAVSSSHLSGNAIDINIYKQITPGPTPSYQLFRKPITTTPTSQPAQEGLAIYNTVAGEFKALAKERGITEFRWGGDFRDREWDPNHFDLGGN